MNSVPYQYSASTSAAAASSTYRRRIRPSVRGAPCSRSRRSAAPHSAATISSWAAPSRVVRRVKRSAVSHRTSQKGISWAAHRFSTRSGAGFSH